MTICPTVLDAVIWRRIAQSRSADGGYASRRRGALRASCASELGPRLDV
jgi:hypothetical protein